jgi:hypothetical protein
VRTDDPDEVVLVRSHHRFRPLAELSRRLEDARERSFCTCPTSFPPVAVSAGQRLGGIRQPPPRWSTTKPSAATTPQSGAIPMGSAMSSSSCRPPSPPGQSPSGASGDFSTIPYQAME